ncbi:MAG: hypothetical protein ACYCSX_00090 [Acidimicrobiales bacterium]
MIGPAVAGEPHDARTFEGLEEAAPARPAGLRSPHGRRVGLRPRPAPEPGVAALVAAAALELWPRAPGVDPAEAAALAARAERAAYAWRFSGRWWTRPGASCWEQPPWAR